MTIDEAKDLVEQAFDIWCDELCCSQAERDATENESKQIREMLDELAVLRAAK
jgi:polyhydroxyalkanoate synthesis regulator phasin